MSDTEIFETSPTDAVEPTAPVPHVERLPRPRIRTGAVIWGLLLVALGTWVLWIATSPARRADALETVLELDPFGWTVIALVVVGGTLTVLALAAVIRRAQHRTAARAS